MKLDFDGDDIVYKEVVIAPWLYHDEILYSLDDKCTHNNITNDCGSISEAIRIIDNYRKPKTKKHNSDKIRKRTFSPSVFLAECIDTL